MKSVFYSQKKHARPLQPENKERKTLEDAHGGTKQLQA